MAMCRSGARFERYRRSASPRVLLSEQVPRVNEKPPRVAVRLVEALALFRPTLLAPDIS
jgi:hypothetical protein